MRPSSESAGADAESLKSVIWTYSEGDVTSGLRAPKYHPAIAAIATATAATGAARFQRLGTPFVLSARSSSATDCQLRAGSGSRQRLTTFSNFRGLMRRRSVGSDPVSI